MIVSTALEYLDSLQKDSGGDPQLRWELASAYAKVGRWSDALPTAKRAYDLATAQGNRDLAARLERMIESYQRPPSGQTGSR